MKTAIIHISDFHIKESDYLINLKIVKMIDSLNVLGTIDKYIVIFSGDLAYSGKVNEYKKSKSITGSILKELRSRSKNEKVDFLMVPGNHDMILDENSRTCDDILNYYKENIIENKLDEEIKKFDNFYNNSTITMSNKKDKIVDNYFIKSGDINIQVNLINSAYYSTLKQNDKELHYFPLNRLASLDKRADLAITVMHHTIESYNEICKNEFASAIYRETDILLTGHNHFSQAKEVKINNKDNLIELCGGQIDFTKQNSNDIYNVLTIDNDTLTCNGYSFAWIGKENIFKHEQILNEYVIKSNKNLYPLQEFINSLHCDTENSQKDFTKYFIFPKLSKINNLNYSAIDYIEDESTFSKEILNNKRILIYGNNCSGKSTLIKKLFLNFSKNFTPLILEIYPSMKINIDKFIKRIFEDQYGDDVIKFEKFNQLPKTKKIIFVDNIDLLSKIKYFDINSFCHLLNENFDYVIMTSSSKNKSVEETIMNELKTNDEFYEYEINPFFIKKRNELVSSICKANNINNQKDIDKINSIVDSLVHNNKELFSLTPSFIVKYIQYFTGGNNYEYVRGEKSFNNIFEYELCESLLKGCKKNELEIYLTIFEIIAYNMFKSKQDTLDIGKIKEIINEYNSDYGMNLKCNEVISVGEKSKLLKKDEDYNFYFANKNHLAYFIAKRIFFISQTEDNYDDANYVLRNICFGINSNIIMFYINLSNNINSIYKLNKEVDNLLKDVTALDLDNLNIHFLKAKSIGLIYAPKNSDREELDCAIEKDEKDTYNKKEIKALGIFDYDESEIDRFENKINKAIIYLEIICKSLPSFYSKITLDNKEMLKESIYKYPEKIIFAFLEPINDNIDNLCNTFLEYINNNNLKKENGKEYTHDDLVNFLQNYGIAFVLSLLDHFIEMCITDKTIEFMINRECKKNTNKLQKLLMLEMGSSLDDFIKEAKKMMNGTDDWLIKHMIKLIVRKHLIVDKSIEFNQYQSIVDTFFGESNRKKFILEKSKE